MSEILKHKAGWTDWLNLIDDNTRVIYESKSLHNKTCYFRYAFALIHKKMCTTSTKLQILYKRLITMN